MTLGELAFSCFVYRGIYKNDAYGEFMEKTNNNPDLSNSEHRQMLLGWLNRWGIRYLAKASYKKASDQLKLWHEKHGVNLFNKVKNLWDLNDKDLNLVNTAYQGLLECKINYRTKNQKERTISFRATAAAKILSAIRPKALVAWDKAIREKYVGSHGSYVDFLQKLKLVTGELKKECRKYGFELEDFPKKLKRPDSTIPKLIDEYNWITITKNCPLPDKQILQQWIKWGT